MLAMGDKGDKEGKEVKEGREDSTEGQDSTLVAPQCPPPCLMCPARDPA